MEIYYGHRVGSQDNVCGIGPEKHLCAAPELLEAFIKSRQAKGFAAVKELRGRAAAKASAVFLTFDDGYRDNLSSLLPLAEKYAVPLLVFVTTGFIGSTVLPLELALAELVANNDFVVDSTGVERCCAAETDKQAVYRALRKSLLLQGVGANSPELAALFEHNGFEASEAGDLFLSWDELRKFDSHPLVTIGAHGVNHLRLDLIRLERAIDEIEESKRMLETELYHSVDYFAYPYGGQNRKIRALVKQAGFEMAFATEGSVLEKLSPLSPYRVLRKDLNEVLGSRYV